MVMHYINGLICILSACTQWNCDNESHTDHNQGYNRPSTFYNHYNTADTLTDIETTSVHGSGICMRLQFCWSKSSFLSHSPTSTERSLPPTFVQTLSKNSMQLMKYTHYPLVLKQPNRLTINHDLRRSLTARPYNAEFYLLVLEVVSCKLECRGGREWDSETGKTWRRAAW